MKTIKIFLASSEELENDRDAFGNLIRKLNKTYNKQGVNLELFEWEDYDAAYNDKRKQDEYNENVRASDMFLAVFHRVAGRFTIEEFDVATEEFRKKASPKVYVYCKNIEEGEIESKELKEFKQRLIEEMGHYWSRYANKDTMQLHFVMQLQMVESSTNESLKVEDGVVVLDGQPIARMENLPFAGQNEDFKKMSARLAELPIKIEKKRLKVEKDPDDEDYRSELQELLNEYNSLKETFAKWQNDLFATAKRVARLQGERVTERMRRAMEAFNEGKIREANIILDEAEKDGEIALQEFDQCKELLEEKCINVVASIEEIVLKISTTQSDFSIPIDDRIEKVETLYEQVILMAQKVEYDYEKYADILSSYAMFLAHIKEYYKALEYFFMALDISKKDTDTSGLYNNIGNLYYELGSYSEALEYFLKSLHICERVYEKSHLQTAVAYQNIGRTYIYQGEYLKAFGYLFKSLDIYETVFGKEHPLTANCYGSIGRYYYKQCDYPKALEYRLKELDIFEKVLGEEHAHTADCYGCVGSTYYKQGDYPQALEYYSKVLDVRKKVLGEEHPDTVNCYGCIGEIYDAQGDYPKALEYFSKALDVCKKVLGEEHPDTVNYYGSIGEIYDAQGDYPKALEYFSKALNIREKVLGKEHPDTVVLYNRISKVYEAQGDSSNESESHSNDLKAHKKVLGEEHFYTVNSYLEIGNDYESQGDYPKALDYYFKALYVYEKVLGKEHPDTMKLINQIKTTVELKNRTKTIKESCPKKSSGFLSILKRLFQKVRCVNKL